MESWNNMNSNSSHNSTTASSNSNNIKSNNNNLQIAPTHSKTPIRVNAPKSLSDMMGHPPVLQRIPASQVEVVYHRKSGESERKRPKSRKTPKTVKQKEVLDTSNLKVLDESLNNQSAQVLEESIASTLSSPPPSHSCSINDGTTEEKDLNKDESQKSNSTKVIERNKKSVVQNLQARFDESSSLLFNSSAYIDDITNDQVVDDTIQVKEDSEIPEKGEKEQVVVGEQKVDSGCNEGCLEIVTLLSKSVEDIKLQVVNLNTRVNNLETYVKTEVEDLKKQRQARLKSARAIAQDMKRMTNVVNSVEWIQIEKDVAQLLDRVKNSPAVKSCPPKTKEKSPTTTTVTHGANHSNHIQPSQQSQKQKNAQPTSIKS